MIPKPKGKPNDRQMQFVVYGAVALALALVLLLFHRPLANRLRAQERKIKEIEMQLSVARAQKQSLEDTDQLSRLMKSADLSLAIDDITAYGRSLGLKFVSITPGEMALCKEGNCASLPISFKIEGGYKSLGKFLLYFEDFPRSITSVESLVILPGDNAKTLDVDLLAVVCMEITNGQK